MSTCDILDIEVLEPLKEKEVISLKSANFVSSKRLMDSQINKIKGLTSRVSLVLNAKYLTLLDTLKEKLSYNSSSGITNLQFLEGNNVTIDLTVTYCNITDNDIPYLASMTQLKSLNLQGCSKITDWSFLENLVNLQSLNAGQTSISQDDYLLIPNKEKLTYTIFYFCWNITDTEFISQFPNLTVWDFRNWGCSKTTDLSFLNHTVPSGQGILPGRGDYTTCQDAISNAKSSWGFFMSEASGITESLVGCSEITHLRVYSDGVNNKFTGSNDILNLTTNVALKEIYFEKCMIENVIVTNLHSLEKVSIINMQQGSKSNITDFSTCEKLNYLNLKGNKYTQADFVTLSGQLKPIYSETVLTSGCPLLSTLYIQGNEINSLAPLNDLISLENVYVSDNNLITVAGIEDLINLTVLDIRNNSGITNVQPILDLMANINESDRVDKSLTVYVSGCSGILNSAIDLISQMENAGVTVVR